MLCRRCSQQVAEFVHTMAENDILAWLSDRRWQQALPPESWSQQSTLVFRSHAAGESFQPFRLRSNAQSREQKVAEEVRLQALESLLFLRLGSLVDSLTAGCFILITCRRQHSISQKGSSAKIQSPHRCAAPRVSDTHHHPLEDGSFSFLFVIRLE